MFYLDPPNPPSITDYNGQPIKIGEILTVNCVVHGGNPLAKITWLIVSKNFILQYGVYKGTKLDEFPIEIYISWDLPIYPVTRQFLYCTCSRIISYVM